MRRMLSALMLLGLTATVGAHQSAQAKPDFSGRWVMELPAAAAGEEQIVRQDEATLSVTHVSGPTHDAVMFKLNGKETRSVTSVHGREIVTLSTAVWLGDRLSITSTLTYPGGRKVNEQHVWALSSDGRKLTIDVTESHEGRPPTKQTLVFKRAG